MDGLGADRRKQVGPGRFGPPQPPARRERPAAKPDSFRRVRFCLLPTGIFPLNKHFARWFIRRLTTCVVVCAFLAFVNWQTSPHYWWVLWVIAGWGLNIALSLAWYLFDCDDECNYRNR